MSAACKPFNFVIRKHYNMRYNTIQFTIWASISCISTYIYRPQRSIIYHRLQIKNINITYYIYNSGDHCLNVCNSITGNRFVFSFCVPRRIIFYSINCYKLIRHGFCVYEPYIMICR